MRIKSIKAFRLLTKQLWTLGGVTVRFPLFCVLEHVIIMTLVAGFVEPASATYSHLKYGKEKRSFVYKTLHGKA